MVKVLDLIELTHIRQFIENGHGFLDPGIDGIEEFREAFQDFLGGFRFQKEPNNLGLAGYGHRGVVDRPGVGSWSWERSPGERNLRTQTPNSRLARHQAGFLIRSRILLKAGNKCDTMGTWGNAWHVQGEG